jgi:hypothetical protein
MEIGMKIINVILTSAGVSMHGVIDIVVNVTDVPEIS